MFGAPIGRIDGWIKQEGPDRREFAIEMRRESRHVGHAAGTVESHGETGDQLSARHRESRLGDRTGQKSIPYRERLLQDRLHIRDERGVRMIRREQSAPAQ